jgi:uncharacterized protein YdhG (YjbR/CyaY superfamily)
MKSSSPVPATIDDYIAAFPKDVQSILAKIRATIRRAAPGAVESISYRIPTYKLNGPLVYFAGFKGHVSLYPVTSPIKKKFAKELSSYQMSTGTVRFPLDQPIPYALIGRIVKFMVQEKKK